MGWEEFGDSCYYFNWLDSDKLSWYSAFEMCDNITAHLVTIESPEEDDFIRSHLEDDSHFWIGLYGKITN